MEFATTTKIWRIVPGTDGSIRMSHFGINLEQSSGYSNREIGFRSKKSADFMFRATIQHK